MVRSYIRTCAASVVVAGLAAAPTGAFAETAVVPTPAAPAAQATPAQAAPAPTALTVTPEATTALAQTIDAELRQWFPPTGPSVAYQWDGRPTVTAAGDHFEVTLPALQVTSHDGSRAMVGVARLSLTPAPEAAIDVALTLPTEVTLLAADGKPEGVVTIGSQHFVGRWLPAAGTFVKTEGAYGDLHAASRKDQTRLDIGALTISTNLTEQPAGRWSGPSAFTIGKLVAVDEQGREVAHLGTLALEATVTGADLVQAVTLGHQPKPEPGKTGTPEDAQAELRRHLAVLHNLFAGASAKLRVTDLVITPATDKGGVTIGEATFEGGIAGLDRGAATLSLGYSHSGLKLQPNPAPPEFLPERVKVAIAATDLPNASLWSAFEALLGPVPAGASEDQAGQEFAQHALIAMTQAGSRLRVDALSIETPAAAANLKGEAHFDGKAALGAVAGFDMVLRGLDAAMKQIHPGANGKIDEDTQSTLAMVSMIQAFGAPGKDTDGRDIRNYKLELGADGRILLNGADMSALLQAGSGSETAPAGAKSGKPAP